MARPQKDNPKNKVIGFRVTSKEYSQIKEKAEKSGAGRPGNLYQFNKKRYQELLKEGIHFEV